MSFKLLCETDKVKEFLKEYPKANTIKIPDNLKRYYHQTKDDDSLSNIKENGLKIEHSSGKQNSEPVAIWVSEDDGFYSKMKNGRFSVPTVELKLNPADVEGGKFYNDIKKEDIVAIHYPWNMRAEYFIARGLIDDVLGGKFDNVGMSDPNYKKAIEYIKIKYRKP